MPGESQLQPESVPDPSVLTTDAIARAIKAERDYEDGRLEVLRERLRGIDEATKVLNETVNRTPTEIQREISHLRELTYEKFSSIAIQFKERDTRQEREARDNKVAVDAAFAAQKDAATAQDEANQKAIDKSEKATQAAMDKLAELVKSTTDALAAQITDLKERVDRGEANKIGGQEGIDQQRAFGATIQAIDSRINRMENTKVGGQERSAEQRQNLQGLYYVIGAVGVLVGIFGALAGAGVFR